MAANAYLLHLLNTYEGNEYPPSEFLDLMGLRKSSQEFVKAAWDLCKERQDSVSKYEVQQTLKKKVKGEGDIKEVAVGCVKSHFFDSGAFTQWTLAQKYAEETGKGRWAYFDTDEFYTYMDDYAEFVKKYEVAIDLYANVDVIGNPDLTLRNQKYLEKTHDLDPVPVVHYKTDLEWLEFYIDRGHDIIGLGGLVGSTVQDNCKAWIDECFDMVCSTPDRLPKVKLHGFGVTTYELLIRYPWYSVDSTSWTKIGAFGGILVPHKRKGEWVFTEQPYIMKVSIDSPDRKMWGRHFLTLKKAEQNIIQEWLDYIKIPLGKMDEDGNTIEYGVVTRHTERRAANLLFFELMRKALPKYPWPFRSRRRPTLGVL
jgi:hypothetical protein